MKKPFYRKTFFKILLITFLAGIIVCGGVALWTWEQVYKPNVSISQNETAYLFIPTGSSFEAVKDMLYRNNLIKNRKSFEWVAKRKGLKNHIKAGKYEVLPNMNNNDLTNLLRSGKQSPVDLTINNIRTKDRLAGRISELLEVDSAQLEHVLNDPSFLEQYGKTPETAITLFIPNTYQFFWNTDAEQFVERMKKEYDKFWNPERRAKAENVGLSIDEIMTLASIVQEETNKNEEKARIAGVYMNRIKSKWPLQADPTLKFALGNFTIRRVLDEHKKINSPYNTYKNTGLPPGPICMPDISSIDAVLDYELHNYYYFCAKDDLSGYHVFSASLSQHNINAKKYHNALNRLKIYQ
ncbi:MAG: endolytic transglycosylase MltG [Bacteroidales bacterium]|jgi:UPF0755 protein|nr:endolytic transglycosylase MltG [Bacteroidales bacterium]